MKVGTAGSKFLWRLRHNTGSNSSPCLHNTHLRARIQRAGSLIWKLVQGLSAT